MPRDENPDSERRPRRDRGERTGRPAKPFVRGSRPPRPAGAGDRRDRPDRRDRSDRPTRSFDRDRSARAPRDGDRERRPARPFDRDRPRRDDRDRPRRDERDRPRRDDGERRPARSFDRDRPRRDDRDRPRRDDGERRPARSFDRDRPARAPRDGDRRDRPARSFDRGRPARAPRRDDRDRGPDTRTDAQRRSDDVKRKTGGRRYGKDPYPPAKHTRERWQDEGSTRKPSGGRNSNRAPRRDDDDDRLMTVSIKNVEPGDANKIKEQLGVTADRAIERLARALHAFEAHRYSEARKLIMPLLSQVVGLAIVHEVAGLSMYRLGRWQDAADQLEIARGIKPGEVVNHPVLADCYRALRRYEKVTELWESMKLLSPPAALLAEGRIVAAGALADQGELQSAVRMMTHGTSDPHKVQEHHLREWYVLADLYDRAGDVASARRLFLKIQNSDAKFADVADRLNTLGE
ncbi:MAG: tetratricopeptide repeat protein [Ilumatobacteraceae bacterium]